MVYYLMGIVDSTPEDNDAASRVSSTLDGFYAQLDDLKSEPCGVMCVPCAEEVS